MKIKHIALKRLLKPFSLFLITFIITPAAQSLAEWSVLTYIQADNSLADFADYNITSMENGMQSTNNINMLVQWDQPQNNKTWRYKIVPGNRIEDGSLSSEMGTYPATELVTAMQWVKTKYPAKKYALILWNHGSGIEDLRSKLTSKIYSKSMVRSWIEVPGASSNKARGILYDDSQGTCLTNPALLSALQQIKQNLGQNLELLGMDACLMAMLEVAYQVKDNVNYFVGSQQTEPGYGWNYQGFVSPLTSNPSMNGLTLAQSIVAAYNSYYQSSNDAQDYTLSAYNLSKINALKLNIDQLVASLANCKNKNAVTTLNMIKKSRNASTEMYMSEYIDLYSFYAALLKQMPKKEPKSSKILNKINKKNKKILSKEYQKSLSALTQVLVSGMQKINDAVCANEAGPQLANVKGISIYYPKQGALHSSYANTLFAQQNSWVQFLQTMRS